MPLIDFPLGGYTTTIPVDLTFSEVAFEYGVIRVHFKSITIRSAALNILLASILSTRFPLVKVKHETSLRIHIHFVWIPVLKVVKGTQLSVNVLDVLVFDLTDYVLVVFKGKAVIDSLN